MVYLMLCLGSWAKLNLAVFYWCWDLSGSIFAFSVTGARLIIYAFAAWYS